MNIYKILSVKDWADSAKLTYVKKLPIDVESGFIHLCEAQQIQKIINNFWVHEQQVVILELIPNKLIGKLIKESNRPGGKKYFHLHADGSILPVIPHQAVFRAISVPAKDFSQELL
jgi:uncharacterized protein (DUF952 family)